VSIRRPQGPNGHLVARRGGISRQSHFPDYPDTGKLSQWLIGKFAGRNPRRIFSAYYDGTARVHDLRSLKGGAILTFARIRSKARQTRVIIAAVVEQRPKTKGDDFRLHNLQIDYELVNNVFVKKSQWIAEIK
jgi:hypothetical protein